MGKAAGALASHAQRFLSDALPEERELTRELMLRLVNEASTRRPRGRSELLQGLAPRAEVVLSRLLAHRLLVSGRPAEREEAQIELAHESLVSNWPALTRWLAETHEARRLSGELEQAAALWVSRGRRDEETWAGSAVQQAFSRASEWKLTLSQTQQEFLEAGRRREVARVKRRRRAFIGAFSGVTALAMLSTGAAYAFRQKQLETLAQQKEITLAAADMGQVTLSLEPFDWSPETLTATPAGLPKSLEWKLHAPDIKALDQPGREYTGADLIRHGASVVDGHLREALEVRSGPAFLEVLGRGSKGERCGSSWVSLKRLPGYSERGSESVLAVPVPTCQASRSGLVRVPAGPYLEPAVSDTEPGVRAVVGEFWLSRTEALRADYEPYHRLHALTGDELPVIPAALDPPADPRLPIVALTARAAERYCGFWGLRLPSLDEWQKAYRGGLELPSGPNPAPSRVVLCEGPKCANIADAFDEPHLAVSGSFPLDVSPYGHLDLMGNVSEWTSTVQSAGRYAGLRTVTGGNWSFPASQRFHQVNKWNTRTPEYIDFSLGVRCAGDGER